MLVLTRRPGESLLIGDHLEIMIVDADWEEFETRLAISAIDADGNDVRLTAIKSRSDPRVVHVPDPSE